MVFFSMHGNRARNHIELDLELASSDTLYCVQEIFTGDGSMMNNMKRCTVTAVMLLTAALLSAQQSWIDTAKLAHDKKGAVQVYFTRDISPAGIQKVYAALGRKAAGKNVAVKISTGEPGGDNYLHPALIGDFVKSIKGTIVECNTAYGGGRAETAMHMQVAKDHGFTAVAKVDIMDADGSSNIPVKNGKHLKVAMLGSHYSNYDFYVILSHFKGHAMGGFGGAIKNIAIGMSSAPGKLNVHTAGKSTTSWDLPEQDDFLESMAEDTKAVTDRLGTHILYISVINNISVDCDCDPHPAAPDMHDIGVVASLDPVAIDQCCVDFIYAAPDGGSVQKRIERQDGTHTLDYAEQIGLGSKSYSLVRL